PGGTLDAQGWPLRAHTARPSPRLPHAHDKSRTACPSVKSISKIPLLSKRPYAARRCRHTASRARGRPGTLANKSRKAPIGTLSAFSAQHFVADVGWKAQPLASDLHPMLLREPLQTGSQAVFGRFQLGLDPALQR